MSATETRPPVSLTTEFTYIHTFTVFGLTHRHTPSTYTLALIYTYVLTHVPIFIHAQCTLRAHPTVTYSHGPAPFSGTSCLSSPMGSSAPGLRRLFNCSFELAPQTALSCIECLAETSSRATSAAQTQGHIWPLLLCHPLQFLLTTIPHPCRFLHQLYQPARHLPRAVLFPWPLCGQQVPVEEAVIPTTVCPSSPRCLQVRKPLRLIHSFIHSFIHQSGSQYSLYPTVMTTRASADTHSGPWVNT